MTNSQYNNCYQCSIIEMSCPASSSFVKYFLYLVESNVKHIYFQFFCFLELSPVVFETDSLILTFVVCQQSHIQYALGPIHKDIADDLSNVPDSFFHHVYHQVNMVAHCLAQHALLQSQTSLFHFLCIIEGPSSQFLIKFLSIQLFSNYIITCLSFQVRTLVNSCMHCFEKLTFNNKITMHMLILVVLFLSSI